MIVGELATNANLHGVSPVYVHVTVGDHVARVEVEDGFPAWAKPAEDSRGMLLWMASHCGGAWTTALAGRWCGRRSLSGDAFLRVVAGRRSARPLRRTDVGRPGLLPAPRPPVRTSCFRQACDSCRRVPHAESTRAENASVRSLVRALWASVQGDPVFMRRLNGWLTIFWVVMIPVSIATGWVRSVTYVSALSLRALVSGHWATWQAARVEVAQQEEIERREDDPTEERVIDAMLRRTDVEPN